LNESGKAVEPGYVGEIAVMSRYLSPGYWRHPETTQSKFLQAPGAGGERIYLTGDLGYQKTDLCLYHLGRKDLMVKIRGHRVEVEEVERTLRELAQVRDAAVAAWDDNQARNISPRISSRSPRTGPPSTRFAARFARCSPNP